MKFGSTAAAEARLTLTSATITPVMVPMKLALGTSAARVREAPLLLVDLSTREGVIGRSYLFAYRRAALPGLAALVQDVVEIAHGDLLSPEEVSRRAERRLALLGVRGLPRMALAAVDMALWDALSQAAGVPLAAFLGGEAREVRAYNSCGLGLMPPSEAAAEAARLLERGFSAVKLRLGHPTLGADVEVLDAVRQALPDEVAIFVDYNQALSRDEAASRGAALAAEGAAWLEEPLRHDDFEGAAGLRQTQPLPVQLGENFDGPEEMDRALEAGACDLVMPDAARIGGVTGWIRAARLAEARGTPMSSHLLPEVSAHLLAATKTRDWLEYVDWIEPLLETPLEVRGGRAQVPSGPGVGLKWDAAAVSHHRLT